MTHSGVESAESDSTGPQKNVVLLTVDSLRADHCGFMGAPWDTTPTLDRLANEGIVFENAIATGPRTPSSMPVAFTGRFPEPVDLEWGDWEQRYGRISEHLRRHLTLPERMRQAGYSTVGITVNPWTQRTAFDKGFDRFEEITGEVLTEGGRLGAPFISLLDAVFDRTRFGRDDQWRFTKDWFVQWPHFYDTVLKAVGSVPEPYFLWVFLLDPHQPYLSPRRFRKENSALAMYLANFREMTGDESEGALSKPLRVRLKRAYRDAIRSTDGFVDKLLADLPSEPTLVLHSDHGEALGEHGNWGHPSVFYEENLHVPVLIHNGEQSGQVTTPFSLQRLSDLVTVVAFNERINVDSFTDEFIMATTESGDRCALRGQRYKYVTDGSTGELFDLQTDSGETADRTVEHPDVSESMRRLLARKRHHNAELVSIGRAGEGIREALE